MLNQLEDHKDASNEANSSSANLQESSQVTSFKKHLQWKTSGSIVKLQVKEVPNKGCFAVVTNKVLWYAVRVWYTDIDGDVTILMKSDHASVGGALENHEKCWNLLSGSTLLEITKQMLHELISEKLKDYISATNTLMSGDNWEDKRLKTFIQNRSLDAAQNKALMKEMFPESNVLLQLDKVNVEDHSCCFALLKVSDTKFNVRVYGISLYDHEYNTISQHEVLPLIVEESHSSFESALLTYARWKFSFSLPPEPLAPKLEIPRTKEINFKVKIGDSDDTVENFSGLFSLIKYYKKWKTMKISYGYFQGGIMDHHSLILLLEGNDKTKTFLVIHYGTYVGYTRSLMPQRGDAVTEWVEVLVTDEARFAAPPGEHTINLSDPSSETFLSKKILRDSMHIEASKRVFSDIEFIIKYIISGVNYRLFQVDCRSFAMTLCGYIRLWKLDGLHRVVISRLFGFENWLVRRSLVAKKVLLYVGMGTDQYDVRMN